MTTLGIPRITPVRPGKTGWFGLGEAMLRIMLLVALPVTAVIFAIQSF